MTPLNVLEIDISFLQPESMFLKSCEHFFQKAEVLSSLIPVTNISSI